MEDFKSVYSMYKDHSYAAARKINEKMFECVRKHLSETTSQLTELDQVSAAIVIAADADEDIHFQQLAAYLEGNRGSAGHGDASRKNEWIVVRLRHIDPDECRSPAVIWHRVLVRLCKALLLESGSGEFAASETKRERQHRSDKIALHSTNEDDDETPFVFTQPMASSKEEEGQKGVNVGENLSGREEDDADATEAVPMRTLRSSTKLKRIVQRYDAEALEAIRHDRNEWRWLRDVAGGYGGMPHELLMKWLSRHRNTLLGDNKSEVVSPVVVVLQLEGVENFASETLEELVRTCTLVKRHLRRIGIERAIQFSLLFGASTETGVHTVIRPWRSALLLSTFWKASPIETIACVETPLLVDRVLPLIIRAECADYLRDIYFADSYSIASYLAGLRLCLLSYFTSSTVPLIGPQCRDAVALEAKRFLLRGLDANESADEEYIAQMLTQCRSLPSVHRAMEAIRQRKEAEALKRANEYADSEDTKTSSSGSGHFYAPPSVSQLIAWRDDLLCHLGARGAALRTLHEVMRHTYEVGKRTSCSLFAIDVSKMQSKNRKRRKSRESGDAATSSELSRSWMDETWILALKRLVMTSPLHDLHEIVSRCVARYERHKIEGSCQIAKRVRERLARELETLRGLVTRIEHVQTRGSGNRLDALIFDPVVSPSGRKGAAGDTKTRSTPTSSSKRSNGRLSLSKRERRWTYVDSSKPSSKRNVFPRSQTSSPSGALRTSLGPTSASSQQRMSRKSRVAEMQRLAAVKCSSRTPSTPTSVRWSKDSTASSSSSIPRESCKDARRSESPERLLRLDLLLYFQKVVIHLLKPVTTFPLNELCSYGVQRSALDQTLRMDYHRTMESYFLTGKSHRASVSSSASLISIPPPISHTLPDVTRLSWLLCAFSASEGSPLVSLHDLRASFTALALQADDDAEKFLKRKVQQQKKKSKASIAAAAIGDSDSIFSKEAKIASETAIGLALVGTMVEKEFPPHGIFRGIVTRYFRPYRSSHEGLYEIKYADGDSERVKLADVKSCTHAVGSDLVGRIVEKQFGAQRGMVQKYVKKRQTFVVEFDETGLKGTYTKDEVLSMLVPFRRPEDIALPLQFSGGVVERFKKRENEFRITDTTGHKRNVTIHWLKRHVNSSAENPEFLVNRSVVRPARAFRGRVEKYLERGSVYCVRYSDGDDERMRLEDLLSVIRPDGETMDVSTPDSSVSSSGREGGGKKRSKTGPNAETYIDARFVSALHTLERCGFCKPVSRPPNHIIKVHSSQSVDSVQWQPQ